MCEEVGQQRKSSLQSTKRKLAKRAGQSMSFLEMSAYAAGCCLVAIPLALIPGTSLLTCASGIFRAMVGAIHGRPLWTAAMPDVPWEAVDVGPAPYEMVPFVWTPSSSRVVRLPGGQGVKLQLASASQPLAYTIEGLLNAEETAQLRKVALAQLGSKVSSASNSVHPKIAVLPNSSANIVATMNRRTAELLRLPEKVFARANLTTTWYGAGGQYLGHHDAMERDLYGEACRKTGKLPTPGGPRFATVVWYLTDVEEGGETMFPFQGVSQKPPKSQLDRSDPCSAIWGKLTIPAKAGTGILWYNYLPSDEPGSDGIAALDWGAFHRGCSVHRGNKLIATRWVPLPLPAHKARCQQDSQATPVYT